MDAAARDVAGREAGLEWILAACRTWLGTASGGDPVASTSPDRLWPAVARLARLHNLEPLLHRLVSGDPDAHASVPASLRDAWSESYHLNFLFNTTLLGSLDRVLAGCRHEGLEVVTFKGLATAARTYGDLGLRVQTDVDLICREDDLPRLSALVRDAGYRRLGETSIYHLEFFDPEIQAGLELHFQLYDFLRHREAFEERVRASAVTIAIDGVSLPAPAGELDLILDVAHLVNHDFALTLKHLLDVALKLHRGQSTLDWDAVATVLGDIDLRPEFDMALGLVDGLFGGDTGLAARRLSGPAVPEALRQAVRSHLLDVDRYAGRIALGDTALRVGWRQRARTVARLLLPRARRLQALHGASSPLSAVRFFPAHVWQVLGRGLRNLRGARPPTSPVHAVSMKRAVYRRRVHLP
jgi:hypothetical protein